MPRFVAGAKDLMTFRDNCQMVFGIDAHFKIEVMDDEALRYVELLVYGLCILSPVHIYVYLSGASSSRSSNVWILLGMCSVFCLGLSYVKTRPCFVHNKLHV